MYSVTLLCSLSYTCIHTYIHTFSYEHSPGGGGKESGIHQIILPLSTPPWNTLDSVSILHFVGVCFFLSCVLFCEKRLKLVTMKRSERMSQSFTSVCYEVWVSEVNVHDFFESMFTSTVDIDRRPIFFWYEGTSTVDIDRSFLIPYRRSISTDFWVKSTVNQISTVFSSRWIHIHRWYRPYSQVGESLSTVNIDRILK